jgi:hypothetical protein
MVEYNLGNNWIVKPSTRKNKKYDVFKDGKYILSFGHLKYEHYFDKLGYYSNLNHLDKNRRKNYLTRSKGIGNINNPYSSNFWSRNFLWS